MSFTVESNKFYISESCYINLVATGEGISPHTHDFLEMVYIFKGRSMQYVDGVEYPVSEGDMIFINLGSEHRFETSGKLVYADVIVKPEFISDSLKGTENAFDLLDLESFKEFNKTVNRNNRLIHFSPNERRRIENFIRLACDEQETALPGRQLILHCVFNTLLTLVFRKMAVPMKTETGIGPDLLKYIKANCAQRLSLEQIAYQNHYSPAYFSRLFKRYTGSTFTEYLAASRIELACKLLSETELSVGDIAAEVGFADRTKFFKCFAQLTGTTPLKYRKKSKLNTF